MFVPSVVETGALKSAGITVGVNLKIRQPFKVGGNRHPLEIKDSPSGTQVQQKPRGFWESFISISWKIIS